MKHDFGIVQSGRVLSTGALVADVRANGNVVLLSRSNGISIEVEHADVDDLVLALLPAEDRVLLEEARENRARRAEAERNGPSGWVAEILQVGNLEWSSLNDGYVYDEAGARRLADDTAAAFRRQGVDVSTRVRKVGP